MTKQQLIIFKTDLVSFAKEVDRVVWSSIPTITTQHFASMDLVLSGFNKEGKALQLRVHISQDFVSDAQARQASFNRAKAKEQECRKMLTESGIDFRDGIISTPDKPIYGTIY